MNDDVYWTGGLLSGKTIDPYIIGSDSDVTEYLKQYIELGVNSFLISNIDESPEEAEHISTVLTLLKGYDRNY